MKTQSIDPYHIIKLLTDPSFFDAQVHEHFKFLNHTCPETATYKRAFDLVNDHFHECTGNYRFASYESWKVCQSKRRKALKKKNANTI